MDITKPVMILMKLSEINTQIFTLPVLTGYVVGNAQTGEIAVVCRGNEFFSVANYTGDLILGVRTV